MAGQLSWMIIDANARNDYMLTQASHFCRMFMNNLALMFEKYFLLINELLMTSNTQWRKKTETF